MRFLYLLLGQLGAVVAIMFCATAGTIGMIMLIRRFTPRGWFPRVTFEERPREYRKEDDRP